MHGVQRERERGGENDVHFLDLYVRTPEDEGWQLGFAWKNA